MSTHPYLPLYVDDYEAATAHLTPEEDGIYNRLLRLCWRTPGCSLPNDGAWIARKVRISTADYERVAKPVVEEFFKVSRGRLVQKRLKAEYDDISRKKSKRVKAGKAGGDAKALKSLTSGPSNATLLLGDMRAFPNPEPEPEEEPPVVPPRGTKSPKVSKDQVQAVWTACPVIARQRSSVADVEASLNAALRRGHEPDAVLAGLLAAYRSETYSGDKAKGVHRLIAKDRWASFVEAGAPAAPVPEAVFDGPVEIRAWAAERHGEPFARSYIDPARWVSGERALIASNPFAEAKLRRELAEITDRWKFSIRVGAANDPKPTDLFAQGAAA